jgi:hypothetical protein
MQQLPTVFQNIVRAVLERFESSDQYVCKQQKPRPRWIIFIEPPQDSRCKNFAEQGACIIDGLVVSLDYLIVLESRLVHQEAVDCNISDMQPAMKRHNTPIDISSGLYKRIVNGLTIAMFILGLINCSIV